MHISGVIRAVAGEGLLLDKGMFRSLSLWGRVSGVTSMSAWVLVKRIRQLMGVMSIHDEEVLYQPYLEGLFLTHKPVGGHLSSTFEHFRNEIDQARTDVHPEICV